MSLGLCVRCVTKHRCKSPGPAPAAPCASAACLYVSHVSSPNFVLAAQKTNLLSSIAARSDGSFEGNADKGLILADHSWKKITDESVEDLIACSQERQEHTTSRLKKNWCR